MSSTSFHVMYFCARWAARLPAGRLFSVFLLSDEEYEQNEPLGLHSKPAIHSRAYDSIDKKSYGQGRGAIQARGWRLLCL
jgi:hypothetical protein